MGQLRTGKEKEWISTGEIVGVISYNEYLEMYNRNEIHNKEDIVLIAVHDPKAFIHTESKLEGFHDVLQMNFWDVEEPSPPGYPPLSWGQGAELYNFITKHKDKQFLIHCAAGMSRSAGVACAVECIVNYHGDDYSYKTGMSAVKSHPRYSPNLTVYDRIIKNED